MCMANRFEHIFNVVFGHDAARYMLTYFEDSRHLQKKFKRQMARVKGGVSQILEKTFREIEHLAFSVNALVFA